MAESAPIAELIDRHRRRLYILLRALLPQSRDAEAAWRQTLNRLGRRSRSAPSNDFAQWANGVAREVAAERRQSLETPFSDDLFRQLADSAPSSLDVADRRPQAVAEILDRLPPPEKELLRRRYALDLTADQIAAAEGRPPAVVSRDLMILHSTLVSTLHDELPDGGPEPPGGATDLGRLTDQLLDGTISDDGRLVLETLLLADAAAQAHYHRHVALAVELQWKYRGEPESPKFTVLPRRRVTARELTVTIAFVAACLAAAVFIALLITGQMKKWWS